MNVWERVAIAAVTFELGVIRQGQGGPEWWLWCVSGVAWGIGAVVWDVVQHHAKSRAKRP